MANPVFVYIDHANGQDSPASWEAIAAGKQLATNLGGGVTAIIFGHQVGPVTDLTFQHGADEAVVADDPQLRDYRPEPYATLLTRVLREQSAQLLLLPTTARTRELAAMSAVDLETGVAPDVIALEVKDGSVVATRPVYAGKLLTKVTFGNRRPQIFLLRSRVFPIPEPQAGRSGKVTAVAAGPLEAKGEVLGYKASEGGVSLTDAAVIVSGGRGVSNNPKLTPPAEISDEKQKEIWRAQQGFALIRGLAQVLGGAVGASRAAVDAGYVPYTNQVGQTGKVVSPDLYIACGISGAIQHLAGMRTSKTIVAINKDPEAPIFKLARFGMVGDLYDLVPALTQELKAKLGK